jgi:2-dehydro-3-deoxyphosphooctonate aldolase (KDO 8-P synthase)
MNSGLPIILFAGPCQIESLDHALMMARRIVSLCEEHKNIKVIYKSSFDKANRSSLRGKRGVGIDEGLKILGEVKKEFGIPVITDVHETNQVAAIAEVVDVIQIPAFLCRQTDLLLAVGRTGRVVNIKKGQFLPPEDMALAAEKVMSTGNEKILLCERGTCFGYRDLVVDFRSLLLMQDLGWPVILDVTHSCMSIGGAGGVSGGMKRFALPYLRAALGVGCQGFFIETHNDPSTAPSDASTMLPLEGLQAALSTIRLFSQIPVSARALCPHDVEPLLPLDKIGDRMGAILSVL